MIDALCARIFQNPNLVLCHRECMYKKITLTTHVDKVRDIKISPPIQTVKENLKPRDFLCSAEVDVCATLRASFHQTFFFSKAFPPAKYFWQFENGTQTRNGAARDFVGSVQRAQGGRYTCTAFNELGNIKAEGERRLSQL